MKIVIETMEVDYVIPIDKLNKEDLDYIKSCIEVRYLNEVVWKVMERSDLLELGFGVYRDLCELEEDVNLIDVYLQS